MYGETVITRWALTWQFWFKSLTTSCSTMDSFTGTDGSTINAGGKKSSSGSCKNFAGSHKSPLFKLFFYFVLFKNFFLSNVPYRTPHIMKWWMSRVIKVWGKVECAENILRELLNSKNKVTNVQENSQLLMWKSTTLYKKSFLLNRPKF